MIICMNYSDDGERHIAYIKYAYDWRVERIKDVANYLASHFDEVYVIEFKETKEFVDEVVLRGCRV